MAASKQDIRRWFLTGRAQGATHMVVVCDTFDHEDYPVFVKPGENPRDRQSDGMGRVMDVYAMHLDMEAQLAEERAFHYDAPPATESAASPEGNCE